MGSRFVYVTFIRSTPQKVWDALTKPEFTRQYWAGTHQESAWTQGAAWKLMIPDGRVGDAGEIIEIDPPRKLVLSWRNHFVPEMMEEPASRCTIEITPRDAQVVKVTLIHESEIDNSKLIDGVANGWPELFASMKSLLETGAAFPGDDTWPEGM